MILEKTSVIFNPNTKIVIGEFHAGAELYLANEEVFEGSLSEFMEEHQDYTIINI